MVNPPRSSVASSEAERLCAEGYAHLEAGRFAEAAERLLAARALAPRHPLIHYRLGLLYNDTRQPAEALAAYDVALALEPGNARAHNNRGSALQQLGQLAEASQSFRRAIALDPTLEPPYVNLGHLLEQQGNVPAAIALYEDAIAQGLDGATFRQYAAAASGQQTTASPEHWVRATFDNFAPNFEAHLQLLEYDVPRQLATRINAQVTGPLDVLDLGCGTGLCAVALGTAAKSLVGVDLSEKMLAHARLRAVYDELHAAEIGAWLATAAAARFDLVIAADVFIYVGQLDALFKAAARVLRPGGWFAFSIEECDSPDFVLLPTGRYAQSHAYIGRLAGSTFDVVVADPTVVRKERGTPLRGKLFLLRKY